MMHTQSDIHKRPASSDEAISEVREGEEQKLWFRSDRFFTAESQWYFTTRENCDVGPFPTRAEAEHGLALFIDCVENQHTEADYAASIALKGDWAIARYQ